LFIYKRLTIPLTTVVVAIEAKNTGKGPQGIRASFDGARLVTDAKHWKCRASNAADWLKPSFDDSTWPAAKEVAYDGNVNAIANKEIVNVAAKWIWSGSSEDDTAYCRAVLGKSVKMKHPCTLSFAKRSAKIACESPA
jgi:hypothetical protein